MAVEGCVGRWGGVWGKLGLLISGALHYPLKETPKVSGRGRQVLMCLFMGGCGLVCDSS